MIKRDLLTDTPRGTIQKSDTQSSGNLNALDESSIVLIADQKGIFFQLALRSADLKGMFK